MENLNVLGISEKEQLVYRTILSVGVMSPQEISRAAALKRPTVYVYLMNLKEAGLVTEILHNGKKYYQAVGIKSLQHIVKARIKELEGLARRIPAIIGALENTSWHKWRSSEKRYSGISGMRALIDEIARSKESVYLLGSIKGLHSHFPPDVLELIYNTPRRRKMAKDYLITDWASSTVRKYFEESGVFSKVRFLPHEIEPKGVFIAIDNTLIIGQYGKHPHAVVFQEPALTELFMLAFHALWADLKGKNIPSLIIHSR